jgi:hypothetical protein
MPESPQYWKVQLWLGNHLIEEHIAPTPLAEQYANVIRLRIHGLPNRHLKCEPINPTPSQGR